MATAFLPGERARPEWLRRRPGAWRAAVAAICVGAFLGQLDASIVALTYGAVGRQFHAGLAQVQGISLAYLVALAVLLEPAGRMSDRFGRKRLYLWGFIVFGIASAACCVAPDLGALIACRAVQGAGAALLQANSVALVSTSAPRSRLRAALGVQAAAQAIGLALGPSVGGLVVQTLGWRWVFALNVPVALVAVLVGRVCLPRTRVVVTRTAGLQPRGLVRDVVRLPGMRSGLFGAFGAYLVLFGPIVLVPTVLIGRGDGAARAGLVVAALPVGFALAALGGERVLPRHWATIARQRFGLAVTSLGLAVALAGAADGGPTAAWLAALALVGLGLGVYTPANNAALMSVVSPQRSASAGGLVGMSRALGTAAATALVAFTATFGSNGAATLVLLLLACAMIGVGCVDGGVHPHADNGQFAAS